LATAVLDDSVQQGASLRLVPDVGRRQDGGALLSQARLNPR
jgi:hypothetical protein